MTKEGCDVVDISKEFNGDVSVSLTVSDLLGHLFAVQPACFMAAKIDDVIVKFCPTHHI